MDFRLFFLLIVCSILVSLEVNSWFGGPGGPGKTRIPLRRVQPNRVPGQMTHEEMLGLRGADGIRFFLVIMDSISLS